MATITDKANLNIGTELTVDLALRTITLNVAGNLVAKDGVQWAVLYSKMVDLWTTDLYNDHPFPFYTIDVLSGQFSIGTDGSRFNDWTFGGSSRLYLRDGGWTENSPTAPGADGTSATGTTDATYAGIVSLGTVSTGAQLYYQLTDGGAAVDFTYDDAANIGVDVTGNTSFFKAYCREAGKSYSESVLADTGKTETGAFIVNMLLSNSDDLNIVDTDANVIDTPISPYDKMRIRYLSSAFGKDIDLAGTNRNFGIVIDCGTYSQTDGSGSLGGSTITTTVGGIETTDYAGGTIVVHSGANKGTYTISGTPTATVVTIVETLPATDAAMSFTIYPAAQLDFTLKQVYTFVQAKLRQATSVNDVTGGGSVVGKTASLLLNFTAKLVAGFFIPTNTETGGSGVLIEGLPTTLQNSVELYDNTGTLREYPSVSAGNWSFNAPLVGAGSYYFMYITDSEVGGDDYGTATAIIVDDADGNPISGTIGASSISFSFDYTGNTQGGRSGGDVPVTLVAGRPGSAKPVVSTGTITDSKSIVLSSVAETDRAYS